MIDLNACKRFCGIVDPEEDPVIALCMNTAIAYHKAAGVPDNAQSDSMYDLSVYLLAGHYYDNRSQIGEGMAAAVPPGVVSCIQLMKGTAKTEGA